MISVKNAFYLLDEHIQVTSETEYVTCINALKMILAENIHAALDLPPFRQSVMDGYALRLHNSHNYKLIGEVQAGSSFNPVMSPGEAVRIFTGAAVPDQADAVVMQEKVRRQDDSIEIQQEIKEGHFIRQIGEQIRNGQLAMSSGFVITPAAVGFLSALGIEKVKVFKKPTVAIVVTGDELREPGENLDHGEIYESNSVMLQTASKLSGFEVSGAFRVKDDLASTRELLSRLVDENDMVLISGGISVGDYDFVGTALQNLGVEEIFYKVKQKPGKPLFFGKKEQKFVFALPGNPASSLSCFYLYVLPALRKMAGYKNTHLERRMLLSNSEYSKDASRAHFLKGFYEKERVSILDGQASSMIHSFAMANALVYLPEERLKVEKDELVETILLPL